MDTKKIKALVSSSYSHSEMDPKLVNFIAMRLNRSDLKKYIQELKNVEDKRTVIVVLPFSSKLKAFSFEKLFPKKKVIYKVDPSLIAGARIIDNDTVYEFNLKDNLNRMVSYITQNYD